MLNILQVAYHRTMKDVRKNQITHLKQNESSYSFHQNQVPNLHIKQASTPDPSRPSLSSVG